MLVTRDIGARKTRILLGLPCASGGMLDGRTLTMNSVATKLIFSLCDYSGSWSEPYVAAGYRVIRVDLGHQDGQRGGLDGVMTVGVDVRLWDCTERPYAVLAAPPCTCFCRPSARWWNRQDAAGQTQHDIEVMRACLRICQSASGWWAMENPPGRHRKIIPELGKPSWQWQPYEYGDPWGKQTYIWGTAVKPKVVNPVEPAPTRRTPNGKLQGRIAFMSSSWKRELEKTPAGFAIAFFQANP